MRLNIVQVLFLLLTLSPPVVSQQIVTLPRERQEEIDRYQELVIRYQQAGNTQQAIFFLNRIAFTYWENGALQQAINHFLKSIPLNERVGNVSDIMAIYSNVGLLYTDLDRYDLALEAFHNSLTVRRQLNSKADIAAGLIDVGYMYTVLNQNQRAIPLLEEALELSRSIGNPRLTLNCLRLLAQNYERIGNLAKAQEMNNMFAQVEQHLTALEIKGEYEEIVGKTQAQVERERMDALAKALEFDLERLKAKAVEDSLSFVVQAKQDSLAQAEQIARQRQTEIDLLNTARELQETALREQKAREQAQQTIIYITSAGLIIMLGLSLVIFKGYRDKRIANNLLSSQNIEIQKNRDQIQRQNENISKSINYAQGIQKALLPTQRSLEKFVPESFIYFKPRDVVSGDYYWFRNTTPLAEDYNPDRDKLAIAAIDCTGHGVPGAFLSMIGYNLLDEIIDKNITKPGDILRELNHGIHRTLRQDETDNRDGMDMALCVVDQKNRILEFAGAKNPVILISNGDVIRVKGDKDSIGGGAANLNASFTTQTFHLKESTWVYMFSDGFIDQFGGTDGRKFMIKNFIELLQHIHKFPPTEQRELLKITFNEWKRKEYPQVDDVLVMGFKV